MAEYIEREKVEEMLNQLYYGHGEYWCNALDAAEACLDNIPAADVRPERYGRWIKDGSVLVCSECGEEHAWDDYRATYCEDCGAKMIDGKGGSYEWGNTEEDEDNAD